VLEHYLVHGEHRAIVSTKLNADAKFARLRFAVEARSSSKTLVRVELETGRYHQIRAQWAAEGHPIVGDVRYGSKTGDGRVICLHCKSLSFAHPVTKEALKFDFSPAFNL
jgi:23S rRNA pseudouridine1911/1915/1917 synthase